MITLASVPPAELPVPPSPPETLTYDLLLDQFDHADAVVKDEPGRMLLQDMRSLLTLLTIPLDEGFCHDLSVRIGRVTRGDPLADDIVGWCLEHLKAAVSATPGLDGAGKLAALRVIDMFGSVNTIPGLVAFSYELAKPNNFSTAYAALIKACKYAQLMAAFVDYIGRIAARHPETSETRRVLSAVSDCRKYLLDSTHGVRLMLDIEAGELTTLRQLAERLEHEPFINTSRELEQTLRQLRGQPWQLAAYSTNGSQLLTGVVLRPLPPRPAANNL